MSKRQTLMVLGIWVIILPFLGFPGFWDRLIMLATGFIIAAVAYSMRQQARPVSSDVPFIEHKNSAPTPETSPVTPSTPMIPPVHN